MFEGADNQALAGFFGNRSMGIVGVIGPILTAALSRHSPILLELLSFLPARGAALR
jgi:hypothetical protein